MNSYFKRLWHCKECKDKDERLWQALKTLHQVEVKFDDLKDKYLYLCNIRLTELKEEAPHLYAEYIAIIKLRALRPGLSKLGE